MEKRLLKRKEAAAYLSLPVRRFNAAVLSGQLPRPVLKDRWDKAAIDRHLDAMNGAVLSRDVDIEERFRMWEAVNGRL